VNVSRDDKTKILARAILDDFRIANGGQPIVPKTSSASTDFSFMKMQAERYLKGDIGWNEMDYTIVSKGKEISREIREATTFGR